MNIKVLKKGFTWFTLIFILGIFLLTITWDGFISKTMFKQTNENPCEGSMNRTMKKPQFPKVFPEYLVFCKGCKELIQKVETYFENPWKQKRDNEIISELKKKCHAAKSAFATQEILPHKTKFKDTQNKEIVVTSSLFKVLPKKPPFQNQKFKTCSVVGNSGILNNSYCGKEIDSAKFVIRCNIPTVNNGYEVHVGHRTGLVTSNPSNFVNKFDSLKQNTHRFLDLMEIYGDAWFLAPCFKHLEHVEVCVQTMNVLKESGSPLKPLFLNPKYIKALQDVWKARHLKERRLSTGFVLLNIALELCDRVDLYGFWPFEIHPHTLAPIKNHYFDERQVNARYHKMSVEYDMLLSLHKKGVLKMHLGDCPHPETEPEC